MNRKPDLFALLEASRETTTDPDDLRARSAWFPPSPFMICAIKQIAHYLYDHHRYASYRFMGALGAETFEDLDNLQDMSGISVLESFEAGLAALPYDIRNSAQVA